MSIKDIFLKKKPVFYSCVIDDSPKFYWQGVIFVTSLIEIAKVNPKHIYLHLIGRNPAFEEFIDRKGVNKIKITSWGDNKYCNKLQQLKTSEFQKAGFVFLCDADIAFLDDISKYIKLDKIAGKTVDFDNPDIDKLKKIFDYFNLSYPLENKDTLNDRLTFDGNFNGGLYGIPGGLLKKLGFRWKNWAQRLLESDYVSQVLGDKVNHIDQVSFCMALKDSKLPYRKLDISNNCPTHIKKKDLLLKQLKTNPLALHFHSKLSAVGLLENTGLDIVDFGIGRVNKVLQKNFENELFWDFRYSVNPLLGSGIGSRGKVAIYKVKLLKSIGIEKDEGVLDVGCGDLEIIKQLKLSKYTGVDLSEEALGHAKEILPNRNFYHLVRNKEEIPSLGTVLCLDVLIHQKSKVDYDNLIDFLVEKTSKRLIVSGYRKSADKSHMCFYYEDIVASLKKTKAFKFIFKIGGYRGLDVFIADKGELNKQPLNPNDIDNIEITKFLNKHQEIDDELFYESASVSRGVFGWYTKHLPRIYEYPWLLSQTGNNLNDMQVADFGSGVTPLPLSLNLRGANVTTIDNNKMSRVLSNINNANEWGYLDYSQIDAGIKSINECLTKNTFQEKSIDIWYSISVVEHLPAETRKEIFSIMYSTLKFNGLLLLTVDLNKNSRNLWNRSAGKQVENQIDHGTLDSIIVELESLGFIDVLINMVSMPESENVDIATIKAVAN